MKVKLFFMKKYHLQYGHITTLNLDRQVVDHQYAYSGLTNSIF